MYTSQPLTDIYRANTSPFTDRASLGRHLGSGQRLSTVWQAVNYPEEKQLTFEAYWLRYQRQALARAIIDKPANATWQELPEITVSEPQTDDESAETDDTLSFEQEVKTLFSGETLRRTPLHRFNVIDRLASLGEYAVLIFGFRDNRELSEPISGVQEGDGPFDGLDDLMYLAVFGQDRINNIEFETDVMSPRFRQPTEYELVTETKDDGTERTEEVHWTRVIHVPEGALVEDHRGVPELKCVFHNLLNINKILAGSAEGYWRGGFQGMVIRPPEGPGGVRTQFEDSTKLAKEISQFTNNFKRTIATTGEVTPLNHSIADPAEHIAQQLQSITAAIDIPKSVLVGQETADRATREDQTQWHETISHRRNTWPEPVDVRPFIDRLIAVGILPEPSEGGYDITWNPLDEPTQKEEAEVAKLEAEALNTLSGGNPSRLASRAELRQAIDWDPQLGSEAPSTFSEGSDQVDQTGPEVDEAAVAEILADGGEPE